jgi:hypothetical protein
MTKAGHGHPRLHARATALSPASAAQAPGLQWRAGEDRHPFYYRNGKYSARREGLPGGSNSLVQRKSVTARLVMAPAEQEQQDE